MNELLSQAKENLSFLGITAAVIIALAVISKLTEKKFTHLRHVSPARRVSIIGICSAIAVVLHILDFPLPFLAPEFYILQGIQREQQPCYGIWGMVRRGSGYGKGKDSGRTCGSEGAGEEK